MAEPTRDLLGCALVGAAIALTGCSGIDHATLDGVTSMPDESTLTTRSGAMHTGIAAGLRPRVWTHDLWGTHEEGSGSIDLQTSNGAVVRVAHVTNDNRYVVWAAGPGQAVVTVTLDGEPALRVPVTVTDAP